MAGLVPAIHAGPFQRTNRRKRGHLSALAARHGVDARDKRGHDGRGGVENMCGFDSRLRGEGVRPLNISAPAKSAGPGY